MMPTQHSLMITMDSTISKRAEQGTTLCTDAAMQWGMALGLRFRLRQLAMDRCQRTIEAYVACTRDKTLSVLWECRGALNDMNSCMRR